MWYFIYSGLSTQQLIATYIASKEDLSEDLATEPLLVANLYISCTQYPLHELCDLSKHYEMRAPTYMHSLATKVAKSTASPYYNVL